MASTDMGMLHAEIGAIYQNKMKEAKVIILKWWRMGKLVGRGQGN
jgi:hypothetical protein